jgi:hypothetical protein
VERIYVINLDRKADRWRGIQAELRRMKGANGRPLSDVTRRYSAVDARYLDLPANPDLIDPTYTLAEQLFVQPDTKIGTDAETLARTVTMSRQEVAVALSHIGVWQRVAEGDADYTLVLEDDGSSRGVSAVTCPPRGLRWSRRRRSSSSRPAARLRTHNPARRSTSCTCPASRYATRASTRARCSMSSCPAPACGNSPAMCFRSQEHSVSSPASLCVDPWTCGSTTSSTACKSLPHGDRSSASGGRRRSLVWTRHRRSLEQSAGRERAPGRHRLQCRPPRTGSITAKIASAVAPCR